MEYFRDRIQNENIGKSLRVAIIEKKMKQNYLILFGHVQRRGIIEPLRKIDFESWGFCKRMRKFEKLRGEGWKII